MILTFSCQIITAACCISSGQEVFLHRPHFYNPLGLFDKNRGLKLKPNQTTAPW